MRVADSPTFLESVANDPRVRPFIGPGSEEVRAGDSWARTLGLEWDTGGIVFMDQGDGVYDAHLLFLPGTQHTLAKCREALRYLFTRTKARKVIGSIPVDNTRARRIASAAGMQHTQVRDGHAHYALTARDWVRAKE